ncbi:ABC transporter ATP-binding protein [Tindallia californiensis]|uniref:Iron complex transport system ATP-binding protein n=1 Tax=Tindallia californiensis TaxID=159292 RepID=A0A1H3MCD2_9FIRM|nr:ABC transporter ATP-binding protein [Tindallia californiensis]SDY74243.1 iron complex transport system ATP-binding protein [Tindallia californiensis]
MLSVKNLTYSYGNHPVLHQVTMDARQGEIISLIGPNGSGKSTLLRCISGLLTLKDSSAIQIDGRRISAYKRKELAKVVAFLPQFQEKMPGITVKELVAFGRTPYQRTGWLLSDDDREAIRWSLEFLQLENFENRMVDQLSGGERQRVWIAMALAQDTPIILLDEPVTYMDLKHQWELLGIISHLKEKFGKTVISVFHDINHALEVSDQICLLHQGKVHQMGNSEQVITEKSIKEVYGIKAQVCRTKTCCRSVVVPEGRKRKRQKEEEHLENHLNEIGLLS